MSEHDGRREWRFYLDDMRSFAQKVLSYTEGKDQGAFVSDGLIHAYLGIDDDTIWSIIQDDIRELLAALEKFAETHDGE